MCSVPVKLKLFNSYCSSLYTPHLWWNYKKISVTKLQITYHNILKRNIGPSKYESTSATCTFTNTWCRQSTINMLSIDQLHTPAKVNKNVTGRHVVQEDGEARSLCMCNVRFPKCSYSICLYCPTATFVSPFHALYMSRFMYINIMGPRAMLVCVLIVWVAVFTPVSASKEVVNDEEVSVLAKRLYDEIKKRLNDYGEKVDGLQDVDMSKFTLQNETIIKTTSSLDHGAQFLNNSVVERREDCAKLCFANAHCNMAVFHSKVTNNREALHSLLCNWQVIHLN